MKHSKFAAIVLSIVMAVMMCMPCALADDDTITLGLITPQTGDVAVYGLAVLNGTKLYIDEINAAGGINGKQVVLIDYDDKGDATEAMNAYNKLVYSDEIDALLGPVTSTPTFGVAEASAYDNVPGITATATHPDVTTYGDNYFRSCFEDPFQGGTICSFAAGELKASTAAIIYNNSDSYSIGLKDAFAAAKAGIGDGFLTSRMNAYDGFEYPWGWGVKEGAGLEVDLTEPLKLIGELKSQYDLPLLNITMGNPYKNPHVNRPYDTGNYVPPEHPIEGLGRVMKGLSDIQHAYPDLPILGSAFSYLRGYAPNLAAAMVGEGHCAMAGFGRMAFANPDFPNQLRETGKLDKTCITCGNCAVLLRAGRCAGCVIHDREVYKL